MKSIRHAKFILHGAGSTFYIKSCVEKLCGDTLGAKST